MATLKTTKLRPSEQEAEEAARYRWLRDRCSYDERITIAEYATEPHLLDHFIDKARAGL